MTIHRRARLIRLAKARNDRLALATLSPKPWTPEPNDYPMFVGDVWAGLRWSKAA